MSDGTGLGRVVLRLDGFALIARAHGRPARWLRDLPLAGRAAVLVGYKRVWRCHERLCDRATWTERRDDVARPRLGCTGTAQAQGIRN